MDRSVDVVVVGGGLSGLAAGRALTRVGKSFVILEASERTGGRIQNALVGGAVCEIGGEWVAPFQKHIQPLLKELEIETCKTYTTGKNTFFYDGKVTHYDPPLPPIPLEAIAELTATMAQFDEMAAKVPIAAPWTAPDAAAWDSQTMASWLDDNILTPGARDALNLITGGPLCAAPRDLSFLHFLFLVATTGGADRFGAIEGGVLDSRVVGGSGVIVEKLTAALADHILLNAPVRIIDQTGAQVRVVSDHGTVTADRVIVAVAPHMAGRIHYDPPLPTSRDQLTQRTPAGWAIKVFASYPTPFWRDAGLNGFVSNPTPGALIDGVFDGSPPSGAPGVLLALVEGDAARALGERPAAERKEAVLEAFAKFFGPQARTPTDYLEHDWAASPWVRGGASMALAPGTWTEYGAALRTPVGRIHWAATETAVEQWGSMDGAISAAERAVKEVLA